MKASPSLSLSVLPVARLGAWQRGDASSPLAIDDTRPVRYESVADESTETHQSSPPATRRVLLVAYNFPPVGGAGVQRPVKWVKYLRQMGWEPTVVTPENPSVPARDESLLADVPAGTAFCQPRTWEPDYRLKQQLAGAKANVRPSWKQRLLAPAKAVARSAARLGLQPDPQLLWLPNALRATRQLLRQTPHHAILVTAPPYSSFYLGARLKREFGLPLILDYRDEWDLSSKYLEHAQRDWWSGWVQERMQRWLLRQADAVIATTEGSRRRLEERLTQIGHPALTRCLYNGVDPADFSPATHPSAAAAEADTEPSLGAGTAAVPPVPAGRWRIVYTGTLWNLTDVRPVVEAIRALAARSPDLVSRLEFVCVGRKTPEQTIAIESLRSTGMTLLNIDYCPHAAVLEWQRSADALLLLLSDVSGAERVVPAKIFEYLASGQELLAVVPAGETADIVSRFDASAWCPPAEPAQIAAWLAQRLEAVAADPSHRAPRVDTLARLADPRMKHFRRDEQTRQLAELFDHLTANQGRTPQ
jgi:glycosyltransferase involved in cell wall biosynthesis